MTLEHFVEECEAIIATRTIEAEKGPVIHPGSLWVSKLTNRRGSAQMVSQGSVKLTFSENGSIIISVASLLEYYVPV